MTHEMTVICRDRNLTFSEFLPVVSKLYASVTRYNYTEVDGRLYQTESRMGNTLPIMSRVVNVVCTNNTC